MAHKHACGAVPYKHSRAAEWVICIFFKDCIAWHDGWKFVVLHLRTKALRCESSSWALLSRRIPSTTDDVMLTSVTTECAGYGKGRESHAQFHTSQRKKKAKSLKYEAKAESKVTTKDPAAEAPEFCFPGLDSSGQEESESIFIYTGADG